VLLDASLSTVLVLALNHLSEVEKKLFTFASIIVSATPYLALVGIALARRRRQLAAEGASGARCLRRAASLARSPALPLTEPNPPRALQPADATLRVGDVRSVDCRALMFAYLIVAGVILTYLACVSFATFYTTRTVQDRETFKIAFSSIYLYMLMPLLEQGWARVSLSLSLSVSLSLARSRVSVPRVAAAHSRRSDDDDGGAAAGLRGRVPPARADQVCHGPVLLPLLPRAADEFLGPADLCAGGDAEHRG
jgi:hypothetical protein